MNMAKKTVVILFLVSFTCYLSPLKAQDTTRVHDLHEVEVQAAPKNSAYLSTSSQQNLNAAQLQQLNALQVSDAVKHFSGVQVKDYGGVGGLKTVSLRSLGANHTNVIYDGLAVSDYQTGQTDLGRFSLDNVAQISLNIGASDNIFQTAQAQSLAGTLHIITLSPEAIADRHSRAGGNPITVALKTGSFDLLNPTILYGKKINSIFSANVSGDYLKTKGNYPFVQPIGYFGKEEHKKRENSDVETLKLEANLKGNFGSINNGGGNLLFKNYFYISERGLPGAAIFYKEEPYYDRLKNRNFFSQIHYQQSLREKFQFQTNAKFSISHTDYFNPTLPTVKQTSLYDQREWYLNATFLYQPTEKISFSWANDGSYSDMEGNQMSVSPSRVSWLSALSGKYEIKQLNVTAKLLNTCILDEAEKQTTHYNRLSPYLGFSFQPFNNFPLKIRGFYKNTFRMPTFGDLYYSTVRISLKPENAQQYNLGATWVTDFGKIIPYFAVNADVYWNQVRDKIIAVPTRSMHWWSVQNIGKVAINGVDLNATAQIRCNSKFLWELNGTYTGQNALNKSPEKPELYNKRIVYTARHSASGNITLKTPWVDAGYNIIYCGKRYNREDNVPISQMSPFTEQGVNLMRIFSWQKTKIALSAECLNIGNVPYEVVNSYPMPARSFRFGIKINY
ncbi:ligand-gated channel [Bacteroidia bacterium]|nr:ligand-gated channel [Bacteroidia bacterium]